MRITNTKDDGSEELELVEALLVVLLVLEIGLGSDEVDPPEGVVETEVVAEADVETAVEPADKLEDVVVAPILVEVMVVEVEVVPP